MRQEHLFCAHVFHALYDEIDFANHQVLFCLDGSAAKKGFGSKVNPLKCDAVPDFCFHFKTGKDEFRMEAKVVKNGRISLQHEQRKKWTQAGKGGMKPHCWIGVDEFLKDHFFWPHAGFDSKIQKHVNSAGPLLIRPHLQQPAAFKDLIVAIKNFATTNGLR